MQVFFSLDLLLNTIIVQWGEQAEKTLENAKIDPDSKDEIYDFISEESRERFLKDVSFNIFDLSRWENSWKV